MDQQFNKTYPARILSKWLTGKQLPYVVVDPDELNNRHGQDLGNYVTSLTVDLTVAGRQEVRMSIQTHPALAGEAFATTAILISRSCQPTFPAALGYEGGPASHTQPNQLFDHILEARDTLQDSALYDVVLCSSIAQLASRTQSPHHGSHGASTRVSAAGPSMWDSSARAAPVRASAASGGSANHMDLLFRSMLAQNQRPASPRRL